MYFEDVPRLSTIQANLLIMKARESAPQRGYFYRAWTSILQSIMIAKDLDLDTHFELHQRGEYCGHSASDCMTRSRTWQALFVLEFMTGAPQGGQSYRLHANMPILISLGRYNLNTSPSTVESNFVNLDLDLDESEAIIAENFTTFVRMIKVVRASHETYGLLKNSGDRHWINDPRYVVFEELEIKLARSIPPSLHVVFNEDGSPPWIESHYMANFQCYTNLLTIMLHRPYLSQESINANTIEWKRHMGLCYFAAKNACRLQESTLETYGLRGLACMLRGINFTVYCILYSTVIYLVSVISHL
jgi:hypothetical protein